MPFQKAKIEFLTPDSVLGELELEKSMVAAEFGSGSGGFTIPLAKRLTEGLVYAIDIQDAPLSALKSRSYLEKLINIRVIRSDLERPKGSSLRDSSVDLVFIINVLFQIEEKSAVMSEAKRVLKGGGKLVVVDWLMEAEQGPVQGRVSAESVKKISRDLGLKPERDFKAGKYHYGLIFEKP
jgi:ubiquinone/menaquinone biosynthesis C-methylase UbiE